MRGRAHSLPCPLRCAPQWPCRSSVHAGVVADEVSRPALFCAPLSLNGAEPGRTRDIEIRRCWFFLLISLSQLRPAPYPTRHPGSHRTRTADEARRNARVADAAVILPRAPGLGASCLLARGLRGRRTLMRRARSGLDSCGRLAVRYPLHSCDLGDPRPGSFPDVRARGAGRSWCAQVGAAARSPLRRSLVRRVEQTVLQAACQARRACGHV